MTAVDTNDGCRYMSTTAVDGIGAVYYDSWRDCHARLLMAPRAQDRKRRGNN